MYPHKHTIAIETDASGDGVGTSPPLTGKIASVQYVKDDYADTVDFSIVGKRTGIVIWSEANLTASTIRAPRQPTHGQDGTASLYAAGGEPVEDYIVLVDEEIEITIAQGGDTKSGSFVVTMF